MFEKTIGNIRSILPIDKQKNPCYTLVVVGNRQTAENPTGDKWEIFTMSAKSSDVISLTKTELASIVSDAVASALAAHAAASPKGKGRVSVFDTLEPGVTKTFKGHKVTFAKVTDEHPVRVEKYTQLAKTPYVVAFDGEAIKDKPESEGGRTLPSGLVINASLPCSFATCKNSRDAHSQYCPDCRIVQHDAYVQAENTPEALAAKKARKAAKKATK